VKTFQFSGLWGTRGWTEPAFVKVDEKGIIQSLSDRNETNEKVEAVAGWALPGVPNTHSHAFQYAMAGLTEHLPAGHASDDFWSWREAMYTLALAITPEQMRALAAYLYSEMLRRGYTAVVEFHYVHHRPDGSPFPSTTQNAEALCEAATAAGIRLTLVPVHYRSGDFGQGASTRQRRFVFDGAEAYLKYAEQCAALARRLGHGVGGGVHSLRASPPEDTLRIFKDLPRDWPRHLHIAEQQKEVDGCLSTLKMRPVEWLLKNASPDGRFHFVHSTQVTTEEVRGIAAAKAHVVLCPTTEGNLGDGVFPLKEYLDAGGRFSIGTDSQVGLNPWEELRWADYQQRLRLHRRNPFCRGDDESGEILLRSAVQSGGRALGRNTDSFLEPGDPLDAVVVDGADPLWDGLQATRRVSTQIFAPSGRPLLGTIVAGRWVAQEGHHLKEDSLCAAFRSILALRRV
jgi:formimidoylglutamate deiminase